MNFAYTEEQESLKTLAQKAAKQILTPELEIDEERAWFRPEHIHRLGEYGLTGIPTPVEYGGAGLGYLEYAIAIEEIAAISASYAISVAVSGLPQVILNLFGTDVQKKKFIPPLARGEKIGAFSLSESQSGSDASALSTRAEKKPDHYLLNGTKLWTTQGDSAETIIVFAKTATNEKPQKSISAFILEKNMPGLKASKVEKKMGLHASHTCELVLENVKVPLENLIGKEGDGFKIAMTALDSGRITIAATAVGVSRAALDYCTEFSKERKQFGKPIFEFQGLQFMLADLFVQLEAARLLTHKAASMKDQKISGPIFSRQAASAKVFATDAAMKITTDAVQILGGCGYTKDYPVERFMRDAKVLQIVEGTNQIQRLVIAKNLTPESTI